MYLWGKFVWGKGVLVSGVWANVVEPTATSSLTAFRQPYKDLAALSPLSAATRCQNSYIRPVALLPLGNDIGLGSLVPPFLQPTRCHQ